MRSLRDLTINGAGEDFEKILTAVDNHTLLDYDGEFDLTRPNERTYCLRPRQGVKCIEADEEVASSFTASFPSTIMPNKLFQVRNLQVLVIVQKLNQLIPSCKVLLLFW